MGNVSSIWEQIDLCSLKGGSVNLYCKIVCRHNLINGQFIKIREIIAFSLAVLVEFLFLAPEYFYHFNFLKIIIVFIFSFHLTIYCFKIVFLKKFCYFCAFIHITKLWNKNY